MSHAINNNGSVAWEPMVYTPQSTFLEKTVTWYYKASASKDNPLLRIISQIAFAAAAIFLTLSLVGIGLLTNFIGKLINKQGEEAFYRDAAQREPPPIEGHIQFDTKTQSFNHVSSYIIHNNIIWYKRRVDDYGNPVNGAWNPMYFEVRPGTKPTEIRVDGANLIVIDNKGEVHYKKVIKEKYENVEAFYQMIQNKSQPSLEGDIQVKTKTQCFDADYSYVIHEKNLWYKENNNEDAEWQPIYLPLKYDYYGKPHLSPEELQFDTEGNLTVIDNLNGAHVIERKHYDRKENYYSLHDKSNKNNWKDRWFSLPYLNRLVNIFTGKKLHLPKSTKAFAIGHRGQYNHYIEDGKGNKHPVASGVTTLYVLHKNGRYIYLYDPWKPKHVKIKIPIPGTAHSSFIAENISVSGSMIMVAGYRYLKKNNCTAFKKPEVLTMIADVDSLAWNPGIKYTYFDDDHDKDPEYRVMPTAKKGFTNHALPKGEITSGITILQTGEGNDAREMRIVGKKDGKAGYWHKMLTEGKWKFSSNVSENQYETDFQDKVMKTEDLDETEKMPDPIVFNWRNDGSELSLDNFGKECITGKLRAGSVSLLLHRKENIIVKILTNGKKLRHYDMVLPQNVDRKELPEDLQPFFKKRRVIRVKVVEKEVERNNQKESVLHIKEVGPNLPKLKIDLEQV